MFASKRLGKVVSSGPHTFLKPMLIVWDPGAFEGVNHFCFGFLEPPSNLYLDNQIQQSLPPGIDLVTASDFKEWQMDIRVLDANPLYLDQTYRLRFRFSSNYPIGTPAIVAFNLEYSPPAPSTRRRLC